MSRLRSRLLWVLLAAGLFSISDASSEERLEGWNNVRFGMSEAELIEALRPSDPKVVRYRTPGSVVPHTMMEVERYEIEGYPFSGKFYFDEKTSVLARIIFDYKAADAESCYAKISSLVQSKYGRRWNKDEAQNLISRTESRIWSLQNGTVRIVYSALNYAEEGFCDLILEGAASG